MNRTRNILVLVMALALGLSSCTILTVGNMVKNGFGKPLMKGDTKTAAKHATPGFAKVINSLSEKEVKLLIGLGTGGGAKKGSKKSGPKMKYHSFSSSGTTALLVVKMGTTKIKFYCRKVDGEWKVNDMVVTGGATRLSLRDVMAIFRASMNLVQGLQAGRAATEHLDGDLRTVLKKAAPALAPVTRLLAKRLTQKTPTKNKTPKKKLIEGFTIRTGQAGGSVTVRLKGISIAADLTRSGDTWRFASLRVELPRREPFYLSTLLRVAFPWLSLFNDRKELTSTKTLEKRLLALMTPSLSAQLSPFVRLGVAWLNEQRIKQTATKQPKRRSGMSLPVELLSRVTWKITDDTVSLAYSSPELKGRVLLDREGLLKDVEVTWGTLRITPADLAGFIPMVHFARRGFTSLDTPKARAEYVREALNFLARPIRSKVVAGIPDRIDLPLKTIFGAAIERFSGNDDDPAPIVKKSGKSFISDLTIKKLGSDRLRIGLPQGEDGRLQMTFTREEHTWKIAGVTHNGVELTAYLVLLPAFIRFVEGAVQLDANLLASSMGDKLGKNLQAGLALMMKLHGRRLHKLGTQVTLLTMSRLMENRPAAAKNVKNTKTTKRFSLPAIRKEGTGIVVAGEHYTLHFALKKDGTYGIDYPPCTDPPAPKKRRGRAHPKSPCLEGYARQDPFQLLELIPLGVGYFMGLERPDYGSLRAFSAPGFYQGVWKKIPPQKLENLFKKYHISIALPSAEELVDMIMIPLGRAKQPEHKRHAGALKGGGVTLRGRGYIFRRDKRYPFAELWLKAKGKEIDVSFAWDKTRKLWLLYDIKVKMGFLGKVSVKKLVNAL